MSDFDVVVVGSGSAGSGAAQACREAGRSVAIVDELPFGGTCQLRGCDPKKVLVGAAALVDWGSRMAEWGVIDRPPKLQWEQLMRFKRTFTAPVPAQREKSYHDAGIATFQAHAEFVDEQTLDVGGTRLRAKHIVLAAGASPIHIAPGSELLLTSTDFLNLEHLPERIVFVGGGFISFEFAHVAVRGGAKVQIVNDVDRPLGGFDPYLVDQLVTYSRSLGIDVCNDAPVTKIERRGNSIAVLAHSKADGAERTFVGDIAVNGAGRAPNLDGLNLEAGGVARGKRGVTVNQYLQSTTNRRVYAAGDCADGGGAPLTPVAGDEGEVAAANLLHGNAKTMDFHGLASCVYTIPAIAKVGLSEREAGETGREFDVHSGEMTTWYSNRRLAERAAAYKLLVEKKTGKILGAHILGAHAEEQINVLALAIRREIPAQDVVGALFAYPSGASDLAYML